MNKKVKKLLILSIISIIILSIPVVAVVGEGIKRKMEPNTANSEFKLTARSSYGDIQAYHPKVLNFDSKWNGYKYWMAFTPYPEANEADENPHILASNDMLEWEQPKGYENPLEPEPDGDPDKIYNSDTHLVYRDDLNRLECYWRYVNDETGKVIIYRKYTTDGVNWSPKEVVIQNDRKKVDYISPAIIFEDNKYKMWYVDIGYGVKYIESNDGVHWSNPVKLNIHYNTPNMNNWHLDVIHTKNGYEMLMSAFKKGQDRNTMDLYYTKSNDNVNWEPCKIILKHSTGQSAWDNRGIYRSCLVYQDGIYYVFYSGIGKNEERGLGISYGTDINNLKGLKLGDEDKFVKLTTEN